MILLSGLLLMGSGWLVANLLDCIPNDLSRNILGWIVVFVSVPGGIFVAFSIATALSRVMP